MISISMPGEDFCGCEQEGKIKEDAFPRRCAVSTISGKIYMKNDMIMIYWFPKKQR